MWQDAENDAAMWQDAENDASMWQDAENDAAMRPDAESEAVLPLFRCKNSKNDAFRCKDRESDAFSCKDSESYAARWKDTENDVARWKDTESDAATSVYGDSEACVLFDQMEAGLEHVQCLKNPKHKEFIPLDSFSKADLPIEYQNEDLVECVKALAKLTCLIDVSENSTERPEFFPGTEDKYIGYRKTPKYKGAHYGTGWLHSVQISQGRSKEKCGCSSCATSQDPHRVFATLHVETVRHVIFNQEEASRSVCYFFFDRGTSHMECPGVVALRDMGVVWEDTIGDNVGLKVYTHDMELGFMFENMYLEFIRLADKVRDNPSLNVPICSETSVEDSVLARDFQSRLASFDETSSRLAGELVTSLSSGYDVSLELENFVAGKIGTDMIREACLNEILAKIDETKNMLKIMGYNSSAAMQSVISKIVEEIFSLKSSVTSRFASARSKEKEMITAMKRSVVDSMHQLLTDNSEQCNDQATSLLIRLILKVIGVAMQAVEADVLSVSNKIKEDVLVLKDVLTDQNNWTTGSLSLERKIDKWTILGIEMRSLLQHHVANYDGISRPQELEEFLSAFKKRLMVNLERLKDEYHQEYNTEDLIALKTVLTQSVDIYGLEICQDAVRAPFIKNTLTLLLQIEQDIFKVLKILHDFVNQDIKAKPRAVAEVPGNPLVVIVSHPHGCSKQVTLGRLTYRSVIQDEVPIVVSYTAATCSGSSGAPVFLLETPVPGLSPIFTSHSGYRGNHNYSATNPERP